MTGTAIQTITATDADQSGTADATITYGIDTATTLFGIVPDTGTYLYMTSEIYPDTVHMVKTYMTTLFYHKYIKLHCLNNFSGN